MYKYIFWDLDGTVTDSAEGILNSVAYALEKLGLPVKDKNTLRPFIGPPLTESFKDFYDFDEERSALGVRYYREYYPQKGIFENRLYDGISVLLKKLSESGAKNILATSKPEVFAVTILKHFEVSQYFEIIAGSTMDTSRQNKTDVLRYAINKSGAASLDEAIMIGDRKHDIIGAHNVGIKCAAVCYGYGSREEFIKYGADFIIDNINELDSFLSQRS